MTRNCSWTLVSDLFLILAATSPAQACEPPELTWARGAGGGGFDSVRDVVRAGDGWVVCGGYNGVATFGTRGREDLCGPGSRPQDTGRAE